MPDTAGDSRARKLAEKQGIPLSAALEELAARIKAPPRLTGPGGFAVALKFVPLGEKAGATELRALEAIRHPNLLSLFASWQAEGTLVLAMELADFRVLGRCGRIAHFSEKLLHRKVRNASD